MSTFIMLTRVAPMSGRTPQMFEALEQQVMEHIRETCPEVKWVANYVVLGPYDYVDIFEAPDIEAAMKVSTIIRSYGGAESEVWAATQWRDFKQLVHGIPHPSRIVQSGEAREKGPLHSL